MLAKMQNSWRAGHLYMQFSILLVFGPPLQPRFGTLHWCLFILHNLTQALTLILTITSLYQKLYMHSVHLNLFSVEETRVPWKWYPLGGSTSRNRLCMNRGWLGRRRFGPRVRTKQGRTLSQDCHSFSRLGCLQFGKEQINTDCESSGDPAYFYWNNWRKPSETRRISGKP